METKPNGPLSWEEALNEIAIEPPYGYLSWDNMVKILGNKWTPLVQKERFKLVAELYATSRVQALEERHKIELSNYAYQMDMAKRERDKAEEENKRLQERLSAADGICRQYKLGDMDQVELCIEYYNSLKK